MRVRVCSDMPGGVLQIHDGTVMNLVPGAHRSHPEDCRFGSPAGRRPGTTRSRGGISRARSWPPG